MVTLSTNPTAQITLPAEDSAKTLLQYINALRNGAGALMREGDIGEALVLLELEEIFQPKAEQLQLAVA